MRCVPGYTLATLSWKAGDFEVYRALRQEDQKPVLIKVPVSAHPSPAVIRQLEHEYEVTQDLDPKLIVRALGLEREGNRVALVLENGVDQMLAGLLGTPMDVEAFLKMAIGIATALAEIHRHDLVNKDIKTQNILLDTERGQVRITGFGIASRLLRERQSPEPPEVRAGSLLPSFLKWNSSLANSRLFRTFHRRTLRTDFRWYCDNF